MGWTRSLTFQLPLAIFWVSAALYAGIANAITLAPIAVRSYLGQNLVVEIDVLNVAPQEELSLKASISSPKAFTELNMDYSQSIADAQVELQRRANGTRFIKLRSARPVLEPFVDLVIEVSSGTAKLVRPYRLLLDPPALTDGRMVAPELAQANMGPTALALGSVGPAHAAPLPPSNADPFTGAGTKTRTDDNIEKSAGEGKHITVRSGDTAGKIADRLKPTGASTDQMLIALLQSNPQAFIRGNVNLIQSGATIAIPPAEVVYQVEEKEARTALSAQAQAFNTLQRTGKKQIFPASASTYATSPGITPVAPASKSSAGQWGDALKLSKNTKLDKREVQKLEQFAKEKNKQSEMERAAELAKNIQELSALSKASTAPSKQVESGVSTVVGAVSTSPSETVSVPMGAASEPTMQASAPTQANAPVKLKSREAPIGAEPDLLDVVIETLAISLQSFLIGLSALGVCAAAVVLARNRKKMMQSANKVDSADKQDIPWASNTAIGNVAYGDGKVDTSISNTGLQAENSMFNAELDPVAEADVYLAYGKDEPAEEILREGLLQDPKRVAIHLKLAEIYAARQDTSNFAICADQIEALSSIQSSDWVRIQALGQSMQLQDPRFQNTIVSAPPASIMGDKLEFENSNMELGIDATAYADSPRVKPASASPALDPVLSFSPGLEGAMPVVKAKSQNSMPFDLDSLALDLASSPSPQTISYSEQLETSMDLAKKFIEIGEFEGARSMLEEVISNGLEEQRKRAQALMATLQ
jgi:pilus assembly protein FimV